MENNLDNAKKFFEENNLEVFSNQEMNVIGKTMRDYAEQFSKKAEKWDKLSEKIAKCYVDEADNVQQYDVSVSFLADEFHEWIELYDWQFNPMSFNGTIKYRWVNETYSSQATTKELYEIFLSQK